MTSPCRPIGLRVAVLVAVAVAASVVATPARAAVPGLVDDGGPEPAPAPADPGPTPTPTAPVPAGAPTSGGDAEPAPAEPSSPAATSSSSSPSSSTSSATKDRNSPAPGPRHRIAVVPRFAYRLGDAGRAVSPAPGFGVGGAYALRYASIGPLLEAALGVEFAFDRFATSEQGMVIASDGSTETFGSTRVITETSFLLAHTIAVRAGAFRPWFTLGAGLGIGYFDSANLTLRPGTASDKHLLGRVAIGIDLPIGGALSATVRGGYTAVRRAAPLVTDTGRTVPIFGDLFDVGVGIAYGF